MLNYFKSIPPYVIPIACTGALWAVGDVMAQLIRNRRTGTRGIDMRRTAIQASYGLLICGPTCYVWFNVLQRHITHRYELLAVAGRVLVDQMIYSPTFLAVYFSYCALMEGTGLRGARERLRTCYFSSLIANWRVWPLAQLINFGLMPSELRIVFVSIVGVFWNAYISHVSYNGNVSDSIPEKEAK